MKSSQKHLQINFQKYNQNSNMKETLTQHEQEMIPVIRDRWLNYILSCNNNLDKEKAAKGIEWLYKFCKKEKPIMIFMDSPLGCQIAANFFINKGQNIWQNIWQNIGQNIGQNIRQNIGNHIVTGKQIGRAHV